MYIFWTGWHVPESPKGHHSSEEKHTEDLLWAESRDCFVQRRVNFVATGRIGSAFKLVLPCSGPYGLWILMSCYTKLMIENYN